MKQVYGLLKHAFFSGIFYHYSVTIFCHFLPSIFYQFFTILNIDQFVLALVLRLFNFKVGLSTSKKVFICLNEGPLKTVESIFNWMLKTLSFLRFLSFCLCPDFWGHVGKELDKKAKDSFNIYDVADWITNIYKTHITQFLKK